MQTKLPSQKLLASRNQLLQYASFIEDEIDSLAMMFFILEEFKNLTQTLDFLNAFTEGEAKLLLDNHWRLDEEDLGVAIITSYLACETIVKEDNLYYYSLFDEQNGREIIDSMPFVYLENILNYRVGNVFEVS